MLLTLIAIFTSVFYLFRAPKIRHWNIVACYLICLFCAWTGLVLSPDVFPPVVLKTVGGTLVLISLVVFLFDFLIEIFQKIRYAYLSKFKLLPPLALYLMEICRAVETLASKKTGALLILERKNKLESHTNGGMPFDAEVKADILIALFQLTSPVHDGAILIAGDRIKRVKTILPLATKAGLPPDIGTRHRSAIGITERTDAVALVVSEERGQISVGFKGSLVKASSQKEFLKLLRSAMRGRKIDLEAV